MKKTIIISIMCLAMLILCGCSKRECMYCESGEVKYEAIFTGGGGRYFLCEDCYKNVNSYPTFKHVWDVHPI